MKAFAAIFYIISGSTVTATAIFYMIERAITEQTVKVMRIRIGMAGEAGAFSITEEFRTVLRHLCILGWMYVRSSMETCHKTIISLSAWLRKPEYDLPIALHEHGIRE